MFLQSIFKLYDENIISITLSESQLVIMVMFNLMINKKERKRVQQESTLNSTVNANSGAHTPTHD